MAIRKNQFDFNAYIENAAHLLIHTLDDPKVHAWEKADDLVNRTGMELDFHHPDYVDNPLSEELAAANEAVFYLLKREDGLRTSLMLSFAILEREGLVSADSLIDAARKHCECSEDAIKLFSERYEELAQYLAGNESFKPLDAHTKDTINALKEASRTQTNIVPPARADDIQTQPDSNARQADPGGTRPADDSSGTTRWGF